MLIARFLSKFNEHPLVKSAFSGLRPAVTGLIAAAAVSVMKLALLRIPAFEASGQLFDLFNLPAIALFAVLFAAMMKWKKLHPVVFILAGAAAGIVFKM